MNIRSIIAVATASAFVAFAGAPALAQEATSPPKNAAKSTQSREKVRDEVKDAKAAGTLDRSGEAKTMPMAKRGTSDTTRADVRDKAKRARADGTLDNSGEAKTQPVQRRAMRAKEAPASKE
jgi:hypothetical protein